MKYFINEINTVSLTSLFRHSGVSSFHPFVHVDQSMRRWRSKVCPRRPRTLREYATILNEAQWRHILEYDQGHLTISLLDVPDGDQDDCVVVFANVELLQTINSIEFCIDATYVVCPRYLGKLQLLTIMAFVNNTVIYCLPF